MSKAISELSRFESASHREFQSRPPHGGATRTWWLDWLLLTVSVQAPAGGRRHLKADLRPTRVSIHAPARGGDASPGRTAMGVPATRPVPGGPVPQRSRPRVPANAADGPNGTARTEMRPGFRSERRLRSPAALISTLKFKVKT